MTTFAYSVGRSVLSLSPSVSLVVALSLPLAASCTHVYSLGAVDASGDGGNLDAATDTVEAPQDTPPDLPGDAAGDAPLDLPGDAAGDAALTVCLDNGISYQVGSLIPRGTSACPISCVCLAGGVIGRCTGACPEDAARDRMDTLTDTPVVRRAARRIDVDGDGFDDVFVATSSFSMGSVSVFLGSARGLATTPAATLTSPAAADALMYASFGRSVASAGDVNGDGYTDLIIGAPVPGFGPELEPVGLPGNAYVYFGGPGGIPAQPSQTLTGPYVAPHARLDGQFGSSVASAGDVNHDGFADVIVGAPDAGSSNTGIVYLYLGGANGLAQTPAVTLLGSGAIGENFGIAVSSAGDVNGDGYDDVLVAASTALSGPSDGGAVTSGVVYLYLGSATGIVPTAINLRTGDALESLGPAMAGASDVNGDGYDDVMVGASVNEAHIVYVFLGSATGLVTQPPAVIVAPPRPDEWFGFAMASVGDLDGDGYGDLVVSGTSTVGAADPGRAYVYLGGAIGIQAVPANIVTPPAGGAMNGPIARAGDVDGDGHPDVVFGDPAANGNAGRAYVYLGGRSGGIGPTPSVTLLGTVGFGSVVALRVAPSHVKCYGTNL